MSVFKINQRILGIGQNFNVYDKENQLIYKVKTQLISAVPKLSIFSTDGSLVAVVQKKLISILPEYEIFIGGKKVATVRKKIISFFGPKLDVEGPGWTIEGDFLAWNWTIKKGFEKIAQADKQLIALTDKYVLTVYNNANDMMALCCALIVDMMEDQESKDKKKQNN